MVRPFLPIDKKKKMVSFMISPNTVNALETMFSAYKEKIFKRFTKTDLFEMAILHLSQDLKKKSIQDMYAKYMEGKENSDATS